MQQYSVQSEKDGNTKFFYILNDVTMEPELLSARYLVHKTRSHRSPNTVRRSAFSICYYLNYLAEKQIGIADVLQMPFDVQYHHFINFLTWVKAGCHKIKNSIRNTRNSTCNAYLEDVFRFYLFIENTRDEYGGIKVLSYDYIMKPNEVGVERNIRFRSFHGYLRTEEGTVRTAQHEELLTILHACTNCRDQLLLLLLEETGFRIGEILGVDYRKDIDYENRTIGVYFRDDNRNDSRAKNASYRKAKISEGAFEFLQYYLAEYRDILQHQTFLFVNISGNTKGQALKADSVYDMLERMKKKTGVKITPHMLRRYFANMRRKAGWPLELIQIALGHKHLETTIRYLNVADDKLILASKEYHEKHPAIFSIGNLS